MTKNEISIDVLGTRFTISADREPEYLKKLLDKYRTAIEDVKKISGLKDPLKIAILTGFLLSDDLEKRGPEISDVDNEAERLTLAMISSLEEILETPNLLSRDKPCNESL